MEYLAVIGDIVDSKRIKDRRQIQEKLKKTLDEVNQKYASDIAADFLITLGDEFQGLLLGAENAVDIIKKIQHTMYPVKLRFGIGIGEMTTEISRQAAIGADGPAFYAARDNINAIKELEKRLRKQAPDIKLSIYGKESQQISQINVILNMIKVIEDSWSEKQRFTIWDMVENGGSQMECARRMNTTQSTIARRLNDGNMIVYCNAMDTVKKALKELEIR